MLGIMLGKMVPHDLDLFPKIYKAEFRAHSNPPELSIDALFTMSELSSFSNNSSLMCSKKKLNSKQRAEDEEEEEEGGG